MPVKKIFFFQYSGFSRYHEDDMAYGGLCQWSCIRHRRRKHWQTLRVSLCEITIDLLSFSVDIAGLTKANLIISVVSCARLRHLRMAVSEKMVDRSKLHIITHPETIVRKSLI